jgi:hypothetical protein
MRNFQTFPIDGTALLESLRTVGLDGFSCDRKDYGTHVSVTTVWLCLRGGTVLRLQPEMHDLEGWDEVGSLKIDRVEWSEAVAPLVELGSQWHDIASIEKLVISEPGYFSAESGLKITNRQQQIIIICNSASPYQLALSTPATRDVFSPEYDLERYSVCPVFLE